MRGRETKICEYGGIHMNENLIKIISQHNLLLLLLLMMMMMMLYSALCVCVRARARVCVCFRTIDRLHSCRNC